MSCILGIVGSRYYTNYGNFCLVVEKWINLNSRPEMIVSGGANGIDTLAERFAKENNIKLKVHPAEWSKYGKAAGPVRNQLIVNDITHLLAIPIKTSIGTFSTIKKAKTAMRNITIVNLEL